MKKIRILDFVLIILFWVAGIFLTAKKSFKPAKKICVKANDIDYEYSANKDGIYEVEGALGITTFEVKGGKIRILDSPCPNKICIHQGWDSPLVCLPNNVIIFLESEGNTDAIAN